MNKRFISISIAIISFVVGITIIPKLSKKLEMHKIELIALLSTRTGKTPKFFTKEMEKDTFYTANECIK